MEKNYYGIKKLENMEKYSSDSAERLSVAELKDLIQELDFKNY